MFFNLFCMSSPPVMWQPTPLLYSITAGSWNRPPIVHWTGGNSYCLKKFCPGTFFCSNGRISETKMTLYHSFIHFGLFHHLHHLHEGTMSPFVYRFSYKRASLMQVTASGGQICIQWKWWEAPSKPLPEAQRTQGIESLTWIIFLTISNVYPFYITQVLDSIAWVCLVHWVCCATTWIGCKFGHLIALFALITNLSTRWRYMHQWVSDTQTHRSDPRDTWVR